MIRIIPAHILASAFISFFAASTSFAGDADTSVGGGIGAAAGAIIGQSVGGKTGAVIGAGVGGASGAIIGKNVTEPPKAQTTSTGDVRRKGYVLRASNDNDDHRKKRKKSKKKDRCDEDHPGRGHAYGKYKDCD